MLQLLLHEIQHFQELGHKEKWSDTQLFCQNFHFLIFLCNFAIAQTTMQCAIYLREKYAKSRTFGNSQNQIAEVLGHTGNKSSKTLAKDEKIIQYKCRARTHLSFIYCWKYKFIDEGEKHVHKYYKFL